MRKQQKMNGEKRTNRRSKTIAIICIVLLFAVMAGVLLFINHINKLRADMNSHLDAAVFNIEQGQYREAQAEANEALTLAQKLSNDEATSKSEMIINLTSNVLRGNEFLDDSSYKEALNVYFYALQIAENIENLDTELIKKAINETEMYIVFYVLIEDAGKSAGTAEYEAAIFIYEEAKQIAITLDFTDGIVIAKFGIEEMQHFIIQTKREEAARLFSHGEQYLNNEQYALARFFFESAMQIFLELNDTQDITMTQEKLDYTAQKIEEGMHNNPPSDTDDPPSDTSEPPDDTVDQNEVLSNFEHNSSIDFDLQTMIDNQNQRPANQIRMGTTEGMNEGWYNGCGWIATHNALIILGNPKHPAEIVRYFEENGGTAFGGVFGTYPNAIAGYLRSLGFDVSHTLFPQLAMDIDDAIKSSRVSILAYAHTSAAHYIAIEYNEEIDKFIVYNDSFARTRSASLGFGNSTNAGAAIDSVSALISNTRSILFSFSLIVVS
jgi:tetratricopeptide (TPR) repeat protein